MPYQAEKDATIPRVIASGKNADGEVTATYESVTYSEGTVIYEADIAPHILRRLDEGDDHLSGLLREIDEAEAREILGQQVAGIDNSQQEAEVLHQEERLGDAPTVEPEWNNEGSSSAELAEAGTEEEAVVEELEGETEEEETEETGGETEEGDEQASEESAGDDLDSMSKRALKRKAQSLDISGRTKMDEDELRAAIRDAEAG